MGLLMDLQNVKHYILKVWRLWSLLHGEFKHNAWLVSLKCSLWCEERAGSVVSFWDVPENTRQGKQRWGTCSPVWLCWRCFQVSEGFREYDLRTIKPDSLPFSWHHGLILAGSVLLCHALRFHWQPEETKHSRRIDGGPIRLRLKAAAQSTLKPPPMKKIK